MNADAREAEVLRNRLVHLYTGLDLQVRFTLRLPSAQLLI